MARNIVLPYNPGGPEPKVPGYVVVQRGGEGDDWVLAPVGSPESLTGPSAVQAGSPGLPADWQGRFPGMTPVEAVAAGASGGGTTVSPLPARAGAVGVKSDNAPDNWRNMTVPQLMAQYSPLGLSKLPLEALIGGTGGYKGFPNDLLQTIIDANPNVLADMPADRLVGKGAWEGSGFPAEALNLFVQNLEARGDYDQNQKIRDQAGNLRGALRGGGLTQPAPREIPAQRTALPVTTSPLPSLTPSPGAAAAPGAGGAPAGGVGEPRRRLGLPRLQQPTGIRAGMSPTELYLAMAGVEEGQLPARTGEVMGRNRLLTVEEGEGGGRAGTETPVGAVRYETDPETGLRQQYEWDGVGWRPRGAPGYAREPRAGRTFDPERETSEERQAREAGRLGLSQEQLAYQREKDAADRAERQARREEELALNNRDFAAAQEARGRAEAWAQKSKDLDLQRATADRALQAELGYAESRRADVRTGLEEAGVTGYYGGEPTFAREREFSDVERANMTTLANRAYQAGQISLRERDQILERERFGLEAELGRGRAGLERAQFQFQVQRDPSSAIQRTFALRGEQAPEEPAYETGLPARSRIGPAVGGYTQIGEPSGIERRVGPAVGGYSRIASAFPSEQEELRTTLPPLTSEEVLGSPYTAPGLRSTLRGQRLAPSRSLLPAISPQGYARLLPSEQGELDATVRATGMAPEDYQARRRQLFARPSRAA